jgi:hypothetical protein
VLGFFSVAGEITSQEKSGDLSSCYNFRAGVLFTDTTLSSHVVWQLGT